MSEQIIIIQPVVIMSETPEIPLDNGVEFCEAPLVQNSNEVGWSDVDGTEHVLTSDGREEIYQDGVLIESKDDEVQQSVPPEAEDSYDEQVCDPKFQSCPTQPQAPLLAEKAPTIKKKVEEGKPSPTQSETYLKEGGEFKPLFFKKYHKPVESAETPSGGVVYTEQPQSFIGLISSNPIAKLIPAAITMMAMASGAAVFSTAGSTTFVGNDSGTKSGSVKDSVARTAEYVVASGFEFIENITSPIAINNSERDIARPRVATGFTSSLSDLISRALTALKSDFDGKNSVEREHGDRITVGEAFAQRPSNPFIGILTPISFYPDMGSNSKNANVISMQEGERGSLLGTVFVGAPAYLFRNLSESISFMTAFGEKPQSERQIAVVTYKGDHRQRDSEHQGGRNQGGQDSENQQEESTHLS